MDGDVFENAPCLDADIFYTDKKDALPKISGYVWTRPYTKMNSSGNHLRCLQNASNQIALKRAKLFNFKTNHKISHAWKNYWILHLLAKCQGKNFKIGHVVRFM